MNRSAKMNILFICTPSSIHDFKWMSFFSLQQDNFNVFVTYESQNKIDGVTKELLEKNNIVLMNPIHSFSIKAPLETIHSIFQINEIIRERKIDIVHILFATPHALWANFISIPYALTTRGSDVLIVLPSLKKSSIYKKLLFFLFKRAFINANAITSTSTRQIEKIKSLFNIDSVELIKTGIEVDKIISCEGDELLNPNLKNRKFIFSPRFMSPIYDIKLQVEAISLLPNDIISAYTFVFVKGRQFDISYYDEVEKMLASLRTERSLDYVVESYLGQEQLWMYFKKASLTLMTPKSDGTPNSALEAMAAKCPLILSDLPYDKDLFDGMTLILKENTPQSLAKLIQEALYSYPNDMLSKAQANVKIFGNRNEEMNKMNTIYVTCLSMQAS